MTFFKVKTWLLVGICSLMALNLTIGMGQSMGMGQSVSTNGDPYRIVDTDLNYAFPNNSLFVYRDNVNISTLVIVEGSTLINDTQNLVGLRLWQPIIEQISNSSLNMTIHSYENLTDDPQLRLNEWDYQGNVTIPINTTLVGVLNGQDFMPEDVFMDDLIHNDDSLAEGFIQSFQESPSGNPFVLPFLFYDYLRSFRDTSNITIESEQNNTIASIITPYDGNYHWDYDLDVILNDLIIMMSYPYQNFACNLSLELNTNLSMNCYNVMDNLCFGSNFVFRLTNMTNTSQTMELNYNVITNSSLEYSTLLACAEGFETMGEEGQFWSQHWLWILLAILGGLAIITVVGLMIQRSNCDEFKQPLNHMACRIGNKYKGKPKK